nr:response regulator [Nocardiopsis sp. FIRDI 009]
MRTLIVDDDFMVARVHRALVERLPGFTVVGEARTGAEALEMVSRTRPDLVLLDVYLPDMNGIDVLRRLRGPDAGADLPEVDVLVITAARDGATVRQALRGGAVQYLIKPFEPAELVERLRGYSRLRRDLDTDTAPDQDAVDRAFGAARPPERTAARTMPKGLTPETADLVRAALTRAVSEGGATADLSAAECAEQTGVSRVSARRYLEYFTEQGRAEVRLRYGTAGRPERRYRWLGG